MNFWIARFKEPSTWRGIIAILSAFGVAVAPAAVSEIVTAGVAAAGVVEMIRGEPQ